MSRIRIWEVSPQQSNIWRDLTSNTGFLIASMYYYNIENFEKQRNEEID